MNTIDRLIVKATAFALAAIVTGATLAGVVGIAQQDNAAALAQSFTAPRG